MKFRTSDLVQNSFAEMALSEAVGPALARLKIDQPTAIQKQALPLTLAGSDLIGIAPTGSGKTLVYALTILTKLQNDPTARALVLTPSRETADQIFGVFTELFAGLPITSCLSVAGLPGRKQVSQLNRLPRLIVATPGRLIEHLANNRLLLQKLSLLIVDEADRMLDQGFGSQINNIRSTLRGDFQTLMFGASFGPAAEKFAESFFRPSCYLIRTTGAGKPVLNLKQIVVFTEQSKKKDRLLDTLRKTKGQSVIFVNDQPNCESVHHHLSENGFSADVIHGAFKHGHRARVVRDFREGKFRTLVTTDLLARGLDIPDIELVVNFDLPNETEDFLHRIGRTARAGKSGTALTFVTGYDDQLYKKFKTYLVGAKEIR
jgi:superfamily II DNA/RNA helicase